MLHTDIESKATSDCSSKAGVLGLLERRLHLHRRMQLIPLHLRDAPAPRVVVENGLAGPKGAIEAQRACSRINRPCKANVVLQVRMPSSRLRAPEAKAAQFCIEIHTDRFAAGTNDVRCIFFSNLIMPVVLRVARLRTAFLGAVREVSGLAQKSLAQRRTRDADPCPPVPALQAAWRVHARVARPMEGRSASSRGPDDNGRGGTGGEGRAGAGRAGGAGARAGGAGSGANPLFFSIRFDEAVSLVMGAAGVAVMLHSAREILLISDMQRWCRSEGQIVRSKIEEAMGGITSSAGKRCNVDVTYSFPDAQGQVHIAHYQAVINSSEARGLVEGQPCVVLFDPALPCGHSTILQGDEARDYCQKCAGVRAVFGAALVAYACYVLL